MKRFDFKLEAVLGYRRQLEEMALTAFQTALATEREAEAEKNRLQDALLQECRLGETERDGWFRLKRDEYKRQLAGLIKMQTERWHELRKLTQEKRERYLESRKETKSLERLREKAWLAYQKELERAEQQEMDDLFLMKTVKVI